MRHAKAERFNRWLRLGVYGAAAVVLPLISGGAASLAVLSLVVLPIGRCVHELRHREPQPPAIAMYIDLVVAPMVTWIALGSRLFAIGLGFAVAVLIYVSLDIEPWVLAIGLFGGLGLSGVLDLIVGRAHPDSSVAYSAWLIVSAIAIFAAAAVVFRWRQLERAFALSATELSSVLDNAPVMLLHVAQDGTLISASGSVGLEWEVGKPCSPAFPASLNEMVGRALGGQVAHGDIAFDHRMFEVTCQPVSNEVLITGFDVTERQEARAELEGLIRTKDEFVASISHELRTPLTAVLGFSSELQRMGAVDPATVGILDTIVDQSAEMASIIEDLLVAVRADLDIFTVVERPVHLDSEVDRVVRAATPRLTKRVHVDSVDVAVLGDGERVRQIVRNLLLNADRHGGPRVSVSVNRRAHVGTVCVRDDGPQIAEDRRRTMFEPFHTSARIEGRTASLGLGLSVSKRLAELMGGRLTYDHLDGWSTFTLELPLAHEELLNRTA